MAKMIKPISHRPLCQKFLDCIFYLCTRGKKGFLLV